MGSTSAAHKILQSAHVAPEIYKLRPDYRALLMVVEGIPPGPSDDSSEALLLEAEASAKHLLASHAVTEPRGAHPPRVNRLTDMYNAVSVKHQVPLGGEDLDKYEGSPFLTRASGREEFRSLAGGDMEAQVECAAPGEPVWCDDAGVTCRRWNWRQGPRTALTDDTTRVLFILDALGPLSDAALGRAAEELALALGRLSPEVRVAQRMLSALDAAGGGS
ncbi:B3/4 domain-containing protein [Metarhizium guizhouense ARSEF 977]|uniref:B3/4 domain-containing protein n=1 Tax=Metarhizium guizhouense (strain ARSEF 977) TaxID=1276136 RepID=A0A0B4HNK9_METGA|nr:B3/4 domain-containing protein [Metarhizium guizhouense ARSEF 977]